MGRERESFTAEIDSPEVEAIDVSKTEKIKKYFGEVKNQKPEIEDREKLKESAENNNILKAEKELELAREKYVGVNFETNSASARIKKFLHLESDLTNKEELDLNHSEYRNKLNELLSLKIDELKSRDLDKDEIGKAMKDLVENFNLNEEANLRKARAKFEPQREKAPEDHRQVKSENIGLESESLLKPAKINFNSIFQGNAEKATESFRGVIALNGKWEDIENMTFSEAARELEWRANKKIENIFKRLKKKLGDNAKPRDGETLEKWTERVSRLAVEKSK